MNNPNPHETTKVKLTKLSKIIKYSLFFIVVGVIVFIGTILFYNKNIRSFLENVYASLKHTQIEKKADETYPSIETATEIEKDSDSIVIPDTTTEISNLSDSEEPKVETNNPIDNKDTTNNKTIDNKDTTNNKTIDDKSLISTQYLTDDLSKLNIKKLYISLLKEDSKWLVYAKLIEPFSEDQQLNQYLTELENTGVTKIPNIQDILSNFEFIYKEIDINCIKEPSSFINSMKYLLANLIYIRDTSINEKNRNHSDCKINLDKLEDALNTNQLNKAYQIFVQNKMHINDITANWGKQLEARIIANNLIKYLEKLMINSN